MSHQLKCTWNFDVIPERQLENLNIDEFDALAIPGGFEEAGFYEDAFSESFQKVIQYFDAQNKQLHPFVSEHYRLAIVVY